MRVVQKANWKDIQSKVKNMEGKIPKSEHCEKNVVQRVQVSGRKGVAMTKSRRSGVERGSSPQKKRKLLWNMCRNGRGSGFTFVSTSKKN